MRALWWLALIASCGKHHGGGPGPDASALVDGSVNGDAAAATNHVFITSGLVAATFGARANADATCASAAASAGLTGTYVAWISTTTQNAIDLLAGSRGWIRTDGLPVADTPAALATGAMLNPIWLDEQGRQTSGDVWTGTAPNGHLDTLVGNCNDWSNANGSTDPGVSNGGVPDFTFSTLGVLCSGGPGAHLYCFETGKNVAVQPAGPPAGARLAFLSRPRTTESSISALDALCQSDATAAGLGGTFLAAVATTTSSIASRYPIDMREWRRIDGTLIAVGADLFIGPVVSFINESADGTYHGASGLFPTDASAWTGAQSPNSVGDATTTCNNWADHSTAMGILGIGGVADVQRLWYGGVAACSDAQPVYCLQQ